MIYNSENQSKFSRLKSFPVLSIKTPVKSIGAFKSYYLQNYGLKNILVGYYISLKNNFFNENPIPNRVVKGKENWYFLGNHFNNVIDDSYGINPISNIDLYNMKQNLLTLNSYFKQKNIAFYFVIPPNKNTVYQEHLPFNIKQSHKKISQLKSIINKKDSLNIIDLTQTLLNKKDSILLYHKTDSHWNEFGAYFGYEEVIKQLNLEYNINKVSTSSYNLKKSSFQGDITNMININEKEFTFEFHKKTSSNTTNISDKREYIKFITPSKEYKLLMFRDSFSDSWIKFFNETFGETVFIRDYANTISKSSIDKEKPNIVILEIAERNIESVLKKLKLSN